jgi:hypothetical protein
MYKLNKSSIGALQFIHSNSIFIFFHSPFENKQPLRQLIDYNLNSNAESPKKLSLEIPANLPIKC